MHNKFEKGNKKGLKFKRHWEKKAKDESEKEVVFGPTLATKWSRALDANTFSELETFLGISRNQDTLLDIGCGPLARAEVQYSLRDFRIVGLDVSRTTLKKAKGNVRKYGKAGNVDFALGDAEFLPFRENMFDVALCIGTISHLPSVESVKKAVKEMRRVIRPHGITYITFWLNLYSFFLGIQDALILRVADIFEVDRVQLLRFRGLREINAIFNCVGLKIKKIRYGALVEFPKYIFYFTPSFVKKIVDKIMDVFNEFHKTHSLFSGFSNVFEVTCENVSPLHIQSIKADAYYQFL